MVSRVQVPDEPPKLARVFLDYRPLTQSLIKRLRHADVAKLADALDLGSSG